MLVHIFSSCSGVSKLQLSIFLIALISLQSCFLSFLFLRYLSKKNSVQSTETMFSERNSTTSSAANDIDSEYKRLCYKSVFSVGCPKNHTAGDFLIRQDDFCDGNIFVLYFIHSAVAHREKRDVIRATWGSQVSGLRPYKVLFVLGTSLSSDAMEKVRNESLEFNDIIQADFVDSYKNLTYKHLYALKWITQHCSHASYIFKADDDVLVNVFRVEEALKTVLAGKKSFIYCEFALARMPYWDKKKFIYYLAPDLWPEFRYPSHCQGLGYLLSNNTAEKLWRCSQWRHYIWIDDLFVTGSLREALDIQIIKADFRFEFLPSLPKSLIRHLQNYKDVNYPEAVNTVSYSLVILDTLSPQYNLIPKLWHLLLKSKIKDIRAVKKKKDALNEIRKSISETRLHATSKFIRNR